MKEQLPTTRGFWKMFFFSLITLGIYGLYLRHAFAKETNTVCQGDGRHTHGLIFQILIGFITLGIYSQIIWPYGIIERRGNYCLKHGHEAKPTSGFFLLTFFLLGPITLGIMDLIVVAQGIHQQNDINRIYNELPAGQ